MPPEEVLQIGRELLLTAIALSLPTVLISLLVGMTISIFQTVTSIQEQTLTFAPRIVAVALVLIATLPWSMQVLVSFAYRMFERVAEVGQ
jgi:flagellar biosynthetic protein FliQ